MISSISSSRTWTPQPASSAFQGNSGQSGGNTSGSSISALVGLLYGDTPDEDDDYTYGAELSSTIGALPQPGGDADASDDEGSLDDISSVAFSKALQQKIATLGENSDTKSMAETMRRALADGGLTVTDTLAGEQVVAGGNGTGSGATAGDIETVATSDWSSFLREHLLRDPRGLYVRNDDTSHVDRTTGESVYFGLIGDNHYYLSWDASR